jgi:hypothetical protein
MSSILDWFSVTGGYAVIYDSRYVKTQNGESILDFSYSLKREEIRSDVMRMLTQIAQRVVIDENGHVITYDSAPSHHLVTFIHAATVLSFMKHTPKYSLLVILDLSGLEDAGLSCSVLLDFCIWQEIPDVVAIVNSMTFNRIDRDRYIVNTI